MTDRFNPDEFHLRMFGPQVPAPVVTSPLDSLTSYGSGGLQVKGLGAPSPQLTSVSGLSGAFGGTTALGQGMAADPSFMDQLLGWRAKDGTQHAGWGGMALSGAAALGNLYMGMQQYGLAKDSLAFQKDQYAKNYTAQKNLTNAQLSDRQARRVQENASATPVAEYMARYGLV